MGYVSVNPNPLNNDTGDCVIRAIAIAENMEWDDVYLELMLEGFIQKDMIESNKLWNSYLRRKGYTRHIIPDTCPDCYTIRDFAMEHPVGTYILGTGSHAVAVRDGNYLDSWDSGNKVPIYYWKKER